jgi:hypothetical protein
MAAARGKHVISLHGIECHPQDGAHEHNVAHTLQYISHSLFHNNDALVIDYGDKDTNNYRKTINIFRKLRNFNH